MTMSTCSTVWPLLIERSLGDQIGEGPYHSGPAGDEMAVGQSLREDVDQLDDRFGVEVVTEVAVGDCLLDDRGDRLDDGAVEPPEGGPDGLVAGGKFTEGRYRDDVVVAGQDAVEQGSQLVDRRFMVEGWSGQEVDFDHGHPRRKGREQVLLAVEVDVDRARGDAGLLGDRPGRYPADAVVEKAGEGGVKNRLPQLLSSRLADLWHTILPSSPSPSSSCLLNNCSSL